MNASSSIASSAIAAELKKLLRSSSHYLFGLIASLLLGFISFPVYTRVFSVADYGMIDFVQKILLLLTAASKLGLQNAALRFYDRRAFAEQPEAAGRYYSTMFFGIAAAASAVTVLLLTVLGVMPKSLIDAQIAAVLIFAGALVFLRAIESMLWSFLRIEERTKAYNIGNVTIKAATIAAVCLLLPWAGRKATTFFSGAITVELVAVIFFVALLGRRGLLSPGRFDRTMFRASVAFGIPLIVYEIASIVLDTGDRALVRSYLGANALGYYSVAYGLSQYVNDLLIVPLNLALLPIYMRMWTSHGRDKTAEFLSVGLDLFLMCAAGVFALATVCCHDAVVLLASSKYHDADRLIPMLVGGLLIYTTHVFLSAGLIIHKNTVAMAKLLLLSAALNIGLNCLLLPRIGLVAAAIATLVSYVFCILLLARASFKVLPLKVEWAAIARYLAAAAVTCAAVSRVSLASPVLDLFARAALAVLLYGGSLCALDRRARTMVLYAVRQIRTRMYVAQPALEGASGN